VLGEAPVGRIEDEVEFVSPVGDGFRPEFLQRPEEGFGVVDFELDLSLARHGVIVREEMESAQWPATDPQGVLARAPGHQRRLG